MPFDIEANTNSSGEIRLKKQEKISSKFYFYYGSDVLKYPTNHIGLFRRKNFVENL